MRVIHVVDSSIQNFDGVSTYINELILSSEKQGDEVLLLCTTPIMKSNLREIGYINKVKTYTTLRCPGKPKVVYSFKFGLKRTIQNFNPDLIWIHSIGTIGVKTAKIANGNYPIVCTKHSFDGELWCLYLNVPKPFQWIVHAFANKFEKQIARVCSFFVYHIQDTQKIELKSYYSKFLKLNPPIQSRFSENRTKKKLEHNKLTLGFCGRCELDKGLHDTFEGLKLFKEKNPDIDLVFYLIGDGPVAEILLHKYDFIQTIVTGYVNDVIPYLDKLDGYILSSKHETISLSSLEAYSRGIPVFSLPIGYLSEFKNIDNFYLFNNNNELVELLEDMFVKQKRNRELDNNLFINNLTISYNELLNTVAKKAFEVSISC